jgi:hypothetical protein
MTAPTSPGAATNSGLFAVSKVQLLYSNIFSFASVHWGRGFGGVPDGAPDGACGRVDRSRSLRKYTSSSYQQL